MKGYGRAAEERADRVRDERGGGRWHELLVFAALFFMSFAALQTAASLCFGTADGGNALASLVVRPSAALIDWITPSESIRLQGHRLVSPRAALAVRNGCDGTETFFLLMAAIVAHKTTLRRKGLGLLLGLALIGAMNIGRVVSLFYVLRFQRDLFAMLHGYLWPALIVLAGGLYFLWWSGLGGDGGEAGVI